MINKFQFTVSQEVAVKLDGRLMQNIRFTKSDFKDATKQIMIAEEVDKKAVLIK